LLLPVTHDDTTLIQLDVQLARIPGGALFSHFAGRTPIAARHILPGSVIEPRMSAEKETWGNASDRMLSSEVAAGGGE
jgi:hypothetical protein